MKSQKFIIPAILLSAMTTGCIDSYINGQLPNESAAESQNVAYNNNKIPTGVAFTLSPSVAFTGDVPNPVRV